MRERNFDPVRFTLLRNKINKGPLFNEFHAAITHCRDDSIVLILDGDDGLVGTQTFKVLNHFYQTKDKWFVYANYVSTIGLQLVGGSNDLPLKTIENNNYREQAKTLWATSHPKTFYNALLKSINPSNFMF